MIGGIYMKTFLSPEILDFIAKADDCDLSDIFLAALKRKQELHPDCEILLLSLPIRDPQERSRILDEACAFLKKHG